MQFTTLAITAIAAFTGLAAAAPQPAPVSCSPGEFICGYELRDILHYSPDVLRQAVRNSQVEPTDIRIDGLFQCTDGAGLFWVHSCNNEAGQEAAGKCVGQNTQFPGSEAFCRYGPGN